MRPEIYTFFAIMAVSIIVFYFLIAWTELFIQSRFYAMFHVISASTNTGFQAREMSVISDEGDFLLIIIMLIGG